MRKIESGQPAVPQAVSLLRDDELDAVSGGKGGNKPAEYLVVTLKDILVTGVQPSGSSQ